MPSLEFRRLNSELRRLNKHFLPDPRSRSPIGSYSDRKRDRIRAFCVLAHAEIEDFIESICKRKVESACIEWLDHGVAGSVVFGLIGAFAVGWMDNEVDPVSEPIRVAFKKRDDPSTKLIVEKALKHYKDMVIDNHGIKKRNIKNLLLPLSIALEDLDEVWLNDMEAYGGVRGKVAHSSRIRITHALDPDEEEDKLESLMVGLRELDGKVSRLS
jgi:hypothetical protein